MRTNTAHSNYFLWALLSWIGCISFAKLFSLLPNIPIIHYIGRYSMRFYVVHWIPIIVASKAINIIQPEGIDPYLKLLIELLLLIATFTIMILTSKHIPKQIFGEK